MHLRFDYPPWMAKIVARNLMWRAKYQEHWTDEDRDVYLHQAIDLNQHVFMQEDELISGMVTWAWLNEEQEQRFIKCQSRLGDFAKESDDDVPWILDMVVDPTSSERVRFMVKELIKTWSNDPDFDKFTCARAFRPDGRLVKFYRNDRITTI